MTNFCKTSFLCVIFIYLLICDCLVVIPEKAAVKKFNPKYMERAKLYVKRAGRRSQYFINLEMKILHAWANNVTVDIIFMEFLHNEYRRTFIEVHTKICDMLSKDAYIGAMFVNAGLDKCPLLKGEYTLLNMSIPGEKFPNIFPMDKGRVELTFSQAPTGDFIALAYLDAIFKK